jgi:hypothetical protein
MVDLVSTNKSLKINLITRLNLVIKASSSKKNSILRSESNSIFEFDASADD